MATGIELSIIGMAVVISILILRKRNVRGSSSLIVFSLALITWACSYSIFTFPQNILPGGQFWQALTFFAATVTASALLLFILTYTNIEGWTGKWAILLLSLEPLAMQILFWMNDGHAFFSTAYLAGSNQSGASPWYWINASYTDGLMILALILLTRTFIHKTRGYLLRSFTIVLSILVPVLAKFASLIVIGPVSDSQMPLVSFTISGALLVYSLYRVKFLDIIPISRDSVVESMSDGWMVLDSKNHIVDLNPAAEELVRFSREQVFGQLAAGVFPNLPKLDPESSGREQEIRSSYKKNMEWRYFSVRMLPLLHPPERQVGQVILWRDITDRRKTDDARQRAREEMFVLLHTISDTAFRTLNLKDFLAESISQIVYSFNSQAGLVFLCEESRSQAGSRSIFLAAHHGIESNAMAHLNTSPEVARMVGQVIEQKEPFFVPDIRNDPRFPPSMQQSGSQSLLILPLIAREQVLGAIGLIRKEGSPAYAKGDGTRLGVVADELATFIRSDRKRQHAIALEERQNLVRDLHDSISQRLYGLVALTEAAQASVETGSSVPAAEIARIGEHARQALKEMRLFLFQMKPVDLETKGLVGALNERLASVEGRASIKTRVLADEDINLSLEKETVLYNIALEALNNVLKHANATTVTIFLRKQKTSVTLEVVDDGCGFDPATINYGGMGLPIMKERVAKVDGQLVVKSAPGKGTRIIATLAENKTPRKARQKRKQ